MGSPNPVDSSPLAPIASERDQAQPPSSRSTAASNPDDAAGSVELLGITLALRDFSQRLLSLEDKLGKNRDSGSNIKTNFIEFCKVVFGGWPALGFLFLLLFYSPLREALNAIPAKVKAAQEIGVLGVSLKSSIQVEAARLGANNLSETIPRLSSAAIELLLRAPKDTGSLISYSPNDQRQYVAIHFPSSSVIDSMSELQPQGLIDVETEAGQVSGLNTRKLIDDFRRMHPGSEEPSFVSGRITWKPKTPLPRDTRLPMLTWQLTDLGKKAVEIILKAVSAELAPKPLPTASPG